MSELSADLTAEATGETVGEAKWAALRELERRHPGLDKAAVQFEVVAEGERGILGVGYEPARVVAHLPAEAAVVAAVAEPVAEEGGQAGEARSLVARIVEAIGVSPQKLVPTVGPLSVPPITAMSSAAQSAGLRITAFGW